MVYALVNLKLTSTPSPPPSVPYSKVGHFLTLLRGGVGNTKQQNTWVLILNMEGKGKELAFVSKCHSRKFIHHRIMLISKKHSAAPKTMRWLLNSSTIIDHTKNHPIKDNVPVRGILTQFSWTNPQKLKFRRGLVRSGGGGDFLWCNDHDTHCNHMRWNLLFAFVNSKSAV